MISVVIFFKTKIKLRLSHFYICFHFPRSIETRDGQGKRFNFYLEILYLFIPFSSRFFMVKSATLGVILSVKEVCTVGNNFREAFFCLGHPWLKHLPVQYSDVFCLAH